MRNIPLAKVFRLIEPGPVELLTTANKGRANEIIKGWAVSKRKERRTFHAVGDGTFVVDGRVLDLKKKMVRWTEFL